MATASFNGTNYALRITPEIGTWPRAHSSNARVYCMSDECFSTSTATTGSHLSLGVLPSGANVLLTVVWPIDSDTYGTGDPTNAAVTGELGLVATITDKGDTVAADPNLFGDITALTTGTPQVIEPGPDGTIYTTTLDMALRQESTPVFLTASQSIVDTEGIAVKMLYTMGGRT